jgi:uncharacterized protein DUF6968
VGRPSEAASLQQRSCGSELTREGEYRKVKTHGLGKVLASRMLRYHTRNGETVDVTVTLGTPVPGVEERSSTWICPFQIRGIRDEPVRAIVGDDAMQALILALHILPTELRSIAREESGSFPNSDEDLGLTHACGVHLAPENP